MRNADQYQVDPEVSCANLEKYAQQRFLNPYYPSNPDFEDDEEESEDEDD